MFQYIKGNTTEINPDSVVLETNEIGYKINTLAKDHYELLENYKIYTYEHMNSENEPVLYGFLELNDLKLFKILIKINGIGAKTAHAILNNNGADVIVSLIDAKDIASLKKIPGIGSKANMVYLELRNKLKDFNISILKYESVYSALIQMNYKPYDIRRTLSDIDQNLSDEDAFREALIRMNYERQQHI